MSVISANAASPRTPQKTLPGARIPAGNSSSSSSFEESNPFVMLTHELGNSLNITRGFSEEVASTLALLGEAMEERGAQRRPDADVEVWRAQITAAQNQMNSVLKRHHHLESVLHLVRRRSHATPD